MPAITYIPALFFGDVSVLHRTGDVAGGEPIGVPIVASPMSLLATMLRSLALYPMPASELRSHNMMPP